ncbi:hypothetical protein [Spirochaeta cellobiosiphila]|uniref:hypothetical protein n=1 Tax=Spirochaeta cellobiosiphila TaxID=504483 RepID=UPI0004170E65|nr:hypothetical protein [Spirochaeta cellobiosiphila]
MRLPTNVDASGFAARSLTQVTKEPFTLITDKGASKIKPTKLVEENGKILVEFADLELTEWEEPRNIGDKLQFYCSLQMVKSKSHHLNDIWNQGMYYPTTTGILLPSPAYSEVITNTEEFDFKHKAPYNHPDLEKENNLSFSLGILAYELLSGESPYPGKDLEDLRARMRESKLVPLSYLVPGVDPQLAQFVDRSLSGPVRPTVLEWQELLDSLKGKELVTPLEEEKAHVLRTKGEQRKIQREKRWSRKLFFRKYKLPMVIISIVVLILGSITGTIIKSALEPPQTAGMTPKAVVIAHYKAINALDPTLYDDTMAKGVKSQLSTMLQYLFVSSKAQMAAAGKDDFYDAQTWVTQGRPVLPDGNVLFGVANLKIKEIEPNTFEATYEIWGPGGGDFDDEKVHVEGYMRKDTLVLTKGKQAWAISELTETIGDEIPLPDNF